MKSIREKNLQITGIKYMFELDRDEKQKMNLRSNLSFLYRIWPRDDDINSDGYENEQKIVP